LHCQNAVKATACTPVITTTNPGTVTIQVTRHAQGGQMCGLYGLSEAGRPEPQIKPDAYIDPKERMQTYSGGLPAGTQFVVWCRRDANHGNAEIRGYIYHR
jgi:hypothetical protein